MDEEDLVARAETPRTGIEGREGEEPVHQSSAHSYEQRSGTTEPGLQEDGGGVIDDSTNTAELLHEHNQTGGLRSAPISWDAEELQDEVATFLNIRFGFEEGGHVEHIASGLEGCGPQPYHGCVRIDVASLTDVLERK